MSLIGKVMVFTGALTMKRAEATKLALGAGAKVTSAVSKKTDIVVAGPDAITTAKISTAKADGTTIWTEEQFKKAIEKGDSGGKALAPKLAKATSRPPLKASAPKRVPPPSEKEQHAFLDFAKNRDFTQVMKLIKENPGYVNVQPAGRWSALHQFAEIGVAVAVEFLVKNGANLDAKTKDGKRPIDVAKDSVKHLLKPPAPKRKAAGAGFGEPAKRSASSSTRPTLHLFESCSAVELSEQMGEWFAGDDECLCEDDVQHKDMAEAPAGARKVAEGLQRALDGATLPGGESDCVGKVVVISNPGDDTQEACLRALAIKKSVEADDDDQQLWEEAEVTEQDWSERKNFCIEDGDLEDDDEDDDDRKIEAATKVLAKSVEEHFEFNFSENVVTAPRIWGGRVGSCIVGVLGMRVWT